MNYMLDNRPHNIIDFVDLSLSGWLTYKTFSITLEWSAQNLFKIYSNLIFTWIGWVWHQKSTRPSTLMWTIVICGSISHARWSLVLLIFLTFHSWDFSIKPKKFQFKFWNPYIVNNHLNKMIYKKYYFK